MKIILCIVFSWAMIANAQNKIEIIEKKDTTFINYLFPTDIYNTFPTSVRSYIIILRDTLFTRDSATIRKIKELKINNKL